MKKYLRALFLLSCISFICIALLNGCAKFDSLDPSEKNDVIDADKVIENTLPQNLLESDYRITGKETAWANLDKAELIYQYQSKFNIIISPSVILVGQGIVETELEIFETQFEVQLRVLSVEEIINLRDKLI